MGIVQIKNANNAAHKLAKIAISRSLDHVYGMKDFSMIIGNIVLVKQDVSF